MKPRIFIASSVERIDLAYAAQENLEHDAEVTVWSQGVFQLSRTTMASLIDQLDNTDFGAFILAPDDVSTIRDATVTTVRDNVIFELGLFIGRLGPERCFMVVPRKSDDLHVPADLTGITPALYDSDRQDGNMVAALGPACNRMRTSIKQQGRVEPVVGIDNSTEVPDVSTLCDDPNDCISLIQSWMGGRPCSKNTRAIRFDDVDSELRLIPGSARKYLAKAAKRYSYEVEREGKDTILFREVFDRADPYF